jgi:hypothetical protein
MSSISSGILQIAVYRYDSCPTAVLDSRAERYFFAKVAGEAQYFESRILRSSLDQAGQSLIGAAIVNTQDFAGDCQALEHREQTPEELVEV